jgi:hypothetical protein
LQHLLPSPLHIAISLQRNLKRIGHEQPPSRDGRKRLKLPIVPQSIGSMRSDDEWDSKRRFDVAAPEQGCQPPVFLHGGTTRPPTEAAKRKAPGRGPDRGFSPHPSGEGAGHERRQAIRNVSGIKWLFALGLTVAAKGKAPALSMGTAGASMRVVSLWTA